MKNIKLGPGLLVSAAFIGPGTVTACTLAGANYGYALLWALVFATGSTIILQEMSARLGVVAQQGLSESLAQHFANSIWKWPLFLLVGASIFLGNAAYEGGNIAGASLGAQAVFGSTQQTKLLVTLAISVIALFVLLKGKYQHIEKLLIALVGIMSITFIVTFFIVQPNLTKLIKAAFIPSIPDGALLTVVALIGTTIVPYNLFLHAASVKEKWQSTDNLKTAQRDTAISIGLGGLIAIFIVSTSAATLFGAGIKVQSAADMALQIEPTFGSYSRWLIGFGLLAAGLSSAITAPLATAYAISGLLSLDAAKSVRLSKIISVSIVLVGGGFALTNIKPIKIIFIAQFANGLLLPIIACFLLYIMNQPSILGNYTNRWRSNVFGVLAVGVSFLLGLRLLAIALNLV